MLTTSDYYICIIFLSLLFIFITYIIPYFRKNYYHDLLKTFIKYIDDQKITFCSFAILVGILILLLIKSYIYPIHPDDTHKNKPPRKEQEAHEGRILHTFGSQSDIHSPKTDFHQPTDSGTEDTTPLPPISNENIKAIPNTLQPINIPTPVQQGGTYDFSR